MRLMARESHIRYSTWRNEISMNNYEKQRKQWRTERRWGIGILVAMFAATAYFALRDDTPSSIKPLPQAVEGTKPIGNDSVKSLLQPVEYSEWYKEGYAKGYAAGEEDTNDGDYHAGFDDSNPYSGKQAADYCAGYNDGYEDGYEEIIETGDGEEEPI